MATNDHYTDFFESLQETATTAFEATGLLYGSHGEYWLSECVSEVN